MYIQCKSCVTFSFNSGELIKMVFYFRYMIERMGFEPEKAINGKNKSDSLFKIYIDHHNRNKK